MKKYLLAVVLLCLVSLCGCKDEPVAAVPTSFAADQVAVAAQDGVPYPSVGSLVPGGAMVTAYSTDGSCYYASFAFADGQKAVEFTYDTATGKVLFRSDYQYKDSALSAIVSQATSEKGYGYTRADGSVAVCKKIATYYANGREVLKRYYDFSDALLAEAESRYASDNGFVYVWRENGRLRLLRSYAYDGAQLFTSEYGIVVGTWLNCGAFGNATVVSVNADGGYTLLFQNCTHRMADGTFYAGLDRFVTVNAAFETVSVVLSKNGNALADYRVSRLADGTQEYTYYENGTPVCSVKYGTDGQISEKVSLDGGDYFSSAPVKIGQAFGSGSVCEQNEDGSFTVVYFDRGYLHPDGSFTPRTTMYAFYDTERKLAGNKYLTDGQTVAESVYMYADDGSFRVRITENGKTVYVSSDGTVTE